MIGRLCQADDLSRTFGQEQAPTSHRTHYWRNHAFRIFNMTVGPGCSYNPDEDTALARCRVSISALYEEQNGTVFWKRIAAAFEKQKATH